MASCGQDTAGPDAEYLVFPLRRPRLPLPLAPKRCACRGVLDDFGRGGRLGLGAIGGRVPD